MFLLRGNFQRIESLQALKRRINMSSIFIFSAIFLTTCASLYFVHRASVYNKELLNEKEIRSSIDAYQFNLSEKLGIVASSTIFIDFLNSGQVSKRRHYPEFVSLIALLNTKSVVGMEIYDKWGSPEFSYGEKTPEALALRICYLNNTLNTKIGDCDHTWTLFFNVKTLLAEITRNNPKIISCDKCNPIQFISKPTLGAFGVENVKNMNLLLTVKSQKDIFFFLYFLLVMASLGSLAIWSWHHLSFLFDRYLSEPLLNLTNCLKENKSIIKNNDIEEIQYLSSEIIEWRRKLDKIKADEHIAKLGKIAAQLAHDVRSPLGAIDMVIKRLTDVPEAYSKMIFSATQRINDITNNFLHLYRNCDEGDISPIVKSESLPRLIQEIFLEKRMQYADSSITLTLDLVEECSDIYCAINETEFKRVISNLVNNSVEAIKKEGIVSVSLNAEGDNARLVIADNGCGIPENLLKTVMSGGVSIGKSTGSGLGLSHAISMVSQWGGVLNLYSEEGIGTKIVILLPLSEL